MGNFMNKILNGALNLSRDVAVSSVKGAVEEHKEDIVTVLRDAISDTIHSMIARKESIHAWAEIAAKGIDPIIQRTSEEQNLKYVSGKLIFSFSEKETQKVDISFELYFVDDEKNWRKIGANSDVYSSVFTDEALEELHNAGKIEYEIKG